MENDNPQKKKIQIISILTLFIFLFDIYIIVNIPKNYILLIIAALLTFVFVLLLLEGWFEWKNQEERELERQYIDIIKMERTAHTASQKKLQDIDDKINFMGQKIMPLERAANINQKQIATMLEALMEGQKKVAKITINHSKENANALINSNDQLLNQMDQLLQSIMDIKQELTTNQNNGYQQKKDEIPANKVEEQVSISEKFNIEENIITPEEANKIEDNSIELEEANKIEDDSIELEKPIQDSSIELEEPIQDSSIKLEEANKSKDNAIELEEANKIEDDSIELDKVITISEETIPSTEQDALDGMNKQSPDVNDPNKMMNPEDIAALIANTSVEELPETTIKIEEEEKPPMPDISETNRVMSPEDIAALIANM